MLLRRDISVRPFPPPMTRTLPDTASAAEELRRRNREATALYEIGRQIAASFEIETILSLIVQNAQWLLETHFAGVALFEGESHQTGLAGALGSGPGIAGISRKAGCPRVGDGCQGTGAAGSGSGGRRTGPALRVGSRGPAGQQRQGARRAGRRTPFPEDLHRRRRAAAAQRGGTGCGGARERAGSTRPRSTAPSSCAP